MKHRILAIIFILAFSFSLCSCSDNEVAIYPSESETITTEIDMEETPRSTCFSAIGYNRFTNTLQVQFRDSGKNYSYDGISQELFNEFYNSDSLGRFYNENIKGKFKSTRID